MKDEDEWLGIVKSVGFEDEDVYDREEELIYLRE